MDKKVVFAVCAIVCGNLFFLGGCHQHPKLSQVPVVTNYEINTQRKMQSLEHWKILAEDVAFLIDQRIKKNKELDKSIYVTSAGSTDFEKTFRKLLITSLVKNNINVTNTQGDHAILNFSVDLISHSKRMLVDKSGVYQTLSPELVAKRSIGNFFGLLGKKEKYELEEVAAGKYTTKLPSSEIMITTSLMHREEYLFRGSDVYYINDNDWDHYKEQKIYDPNLAKRYKIVGD